MTAGKMQLEQKKKNKKKNKNRLNPAGVESMKHSSRAVEL